MEGEAENGDHPVRRIFAFEDLHILFTDRASFEELRQLLPILLRVIWVFLH